MEILLDIPNMEGKYSLDVSQKPAQIWSHKRAGSSGKHIPAIISNGMRQVNIIHKDKKVYVPMCELIYRAYNPHIELKNYILYFKDGNKMNDYIDNLAVKDKYVRDCGGNIILRFE